MPKGVIEPPPPWELAVLSPQVEADMSMRVLELPGQTSNKGALAFFAVTGYIFHSSKLRITFSAKAQTQSSHCND